MSESGQRAISREAQVEALMEQVRILEAANQAEQLTKEDILACEQDNLVITSIPEDERTEDQQRKLAINLRVIACLKATLEPQDTSVVRASTTGGAGTLEEKEEDEEIF